jgi:hypothetical protein
MEGFQVVTSDDCNLGHVVGRQGDFLIIEHGRLRKARHAVPEAFAHADEGEKVVRLSIAKQIICDSPKLNGEADEQAIAEHYGLAGAFEAPETEGYGDVLPDDPSRSAEQDAIRAGMDPAPAQRAQTREGGMDAGTPTEGSPGLLGDRYRNN